MRRWPRRVRTRCCWCCPRITRSTTSKAFQAAIRLAVTAGQTGQLVAFGIVARTPETGYGYIRRGTGAGAVKPIARFVEKPDLARAKEFVASGEYFWNSGMFLFGARRFLDELAQYAPDIAEVCARASATVVRDTDFTRVDGATFAACRSDSVDYAVMEKTRDAVMVPLDAGWNDVGSWAALHEVLPADEHGNVARGDVLLEDTIGFLRACRQPAGGGPGPAWHGHRGNRRCRAGGAQGQGAGRQETRGAHQGRGRAEHVAHAVHVARVRSKGKPE